MKKNYKIIVVILTILGLGLIFKLWLIGSKITVLGIGGYIGVLFGWNFEYFWISAGYISVILFGISIFLIFLIIKARNKITKLKIATIILFLGLIGNPIFFLVSPDFKFFLTPVTSQYKDKEGNIEDVDKYLESIGKYCTYTGLNGLSYKYGRLDMCSQHNKFQTNFKTAEEYIKVLEYAKNNDHRLLYRRTYGGVKNFGLEQILKKYDDETLQAYATERTSDLSYLTLLETYTTNSKLKNIINLEIKKIRYYFDNEESFSMEEGYKYWEDLSKDFSRELKQIPEVNKSIF